MKMSLSGLLVLLCVSAAACKQPSSQDTTLDTDHQRLGYSLGVDFTRKLKNRGIALDSDSFLLGMRQIQAGDKLLMDESEIQASLSGMRETIRQQTEQAAAENRKAGQALQGSNAADNGVTILPGGLQYRILNTGDGARPGPDDVVVINALGKLADGTVFTRTGEPGNNGVFAIKQLMPGLARAIREMRVGDRWELVIPPELAYGKKGFGTLVGPEATLIYDLELLAIR